ncbi:hypothetical protein J4448_01735 [Candidatus Woesearchaeota archaeon]|nr:hypothetical protein [Candidatus Woesearchaeota archaeon]
MNNAVVFFKGFKQGFRNFSHLITDIVNFVLLFIVYFTGIGIVSIISKLFGKHFMDLKSSGSSWVVRKLKKRPIEEYYRLF